MTESRSGPRGAISPLAAALSNRCQNCGEGPLSSGFLETIERCAVCGADYRRHAAGDGAVYVVLTTLCFVVMGIVVGVEFAYRPPVWVHALLAVGATVLLTLLLLPPAKRFMVAQSFAMDARGDGHAGDHGGGAPDGDGPA